MSRLLKDIVDLEILSFGPDFLCAPSPLSARFKLRVSNIIRENRTRQIEKHTNTLKYPHYLCPRMTFCDRNIPRFKEIEKLELVPKRCTDSWKKKIRWHNFPYRNATTKHLDNVTLLWLGFSFLSNPEALEWEHVASTLSDRDRLSDDCPQFGSEWRQSQKC